MMEVLPIPPGPIRATGVRLSTKQTIPSINVSRPQKILGAGGGNTPGVLDAMSSVGSLGGRGCVPILGLGSGQHELESGTKYIFHSPGSGRPYSTCPGEYR